MSDIHALTGAYAVDAVDDIERASFERHLATCEDCRAEVESLREAAAAMADDVATAPPPELRAAILDGITRVRPLPPVTVPDTVDEEAPAHRRRWFPALVAAAVLAIVGVGAAVTQPWQDDSSQTVNVADRVLADPDAQHLVRKIGDAQATIVRSTKEHAAVIVTDNMPPAPDGKVYQLWLQDRDKTFVSAGLMPVGKTTVLLQGDPDDAMAVGLSVEPAGGSTQPTDVVAVFDLDKKV
jgi:anti-sigma-K factor RskA